MVQSHASYRLDDLGTTLVRMERFELSASGSRNQRSARLSYTLINLVGVVGFGPTTPRPQTECSSR